MPLKNKMNKRVAPTSLKVKVESDDSEEEEIDRKGLEWAKWNGLIHMKIRELIQQGHLASEGDVEEIERVKILTQWEKYSAAFVLEELEVFDDGKNEIDQLSDSDSD